MSRKSRDWGQVPAKPGVDVEVVPEEGIVPAVKVAAKVIGSHWEVCEECGRKVWLEFGKEYYHRLKCSKSNGIPYGDENPKSVAFNRFNREERQ